MSASAPCAWCRLRGLFGSASSAVGLLEWQCPWKFLPDPLYIGVRLGLHRDYIGMMESKMETTI